MTLPDRPQVEHDTFTCGHCQRIVEVKPRCDAADAGGLCKVCMQLVCSRCVEAMVKRGEPCTPWAKKMERIEARDRFLRSAGL